MTQPLWLQFGLDTELEQVLILGACDERYMVAKRNAELILPEKPLLIVNAREGFMDVRERLIKFLKEHGLSEEKIASVVLGVGLHLKQIFGVKPNELPIETAPRSGVFIAKGTDGNEYRATQHETCFLGRKLDDDTDSEKPVLHILETKDITSWRPLP